MYRLIWIFLFCLTLITACNRASHQASNLPQDDFIQAYFNHRENDRTYTDSYRQIERPGDDLEAVIINGISQANSTVDLAVQELNLPLIAQALVKSHKSGVRVRVIVDNNYSRPLSSLTEQEIEGLNQRDRLKYDEFFQLVDLNQNGRLSPQETAQGDALVVLEQAGIPVIDDTADGSAGSGLMHHKFVVIDGHKVITGSANFTLSDIHGDFSNLDNRGNVNNLLSIENQEVAGLFTEEFAYMWGGGEKGGVFSQFGLNKPRRSPTKISWKNTDITIQFSPTSTSEDWYSSGNGLIGQIINGANKSVDLALFVLSEQEIADILQAKQRQGMIIRGVFDPGFAFRYYSEVLDMVGVTLLNLSTASQGNKCQVEIGNNPWLKPSTTIGVADLNFGDKLHHKFSLVDSQILISGSQNWSKAANDTNDETLIVINNALVAQQFKQEFERLYRSALFELPQKVASKVKDQKQKCSL